MRAYAEPPRNPGGRGRDIDWHGIVKEIEEAELLGLYASPEALQKQERIASLYLIVKNYNNPALRELRDEGYTIEPRTTNTFTGVNGVRGGDLLLRITKSKKKGAR